MYKRVTISGTIGGSIWMPAVVCTKEFTANNDQWPYNAYTEDGKSVPATLRDMVLGITRDGDFQSCSIVDATVAFERSRVVGKRTITTVRYMDIREFPSVADCVVELDSEEYEDMVGCCQEVE